MWPGCRNAHPVVHKIMIHLSFVTYRAQIPAKSLEFTQNSIRCRNWVPNPLCPDPKSPGPDPRPISLFIAKLFHVVGIAICDKSGISPGKGDKRFLFPHTECAYEQVPLSYSLLQYRPRAVERDFDPGLTVTLVQGCLFVPHLHRSEQKQPLTKHGQEPLFSILLQIFAHLRLLPGSAQCLSTSNSDMLVLPAITVRSSVSRRAPTGGR